MGEEYGEENPFLFFCSFGDHELIENVRHGRRRDYTLVGDVPDPQDERTMQQSRLSWQWPEGSSRAGLRRLYQDLLAARRSWPAMRNFSDRQATLLPDAAGSRVLELLRGTDGDDAGKIAIYFNLCDEERALPSTTHGNLLFSSEALRYQGNPTDVRDGAKLAPFECVVFGPATYQALGVK
jgi:maltooligosyltrehalose trehalohydrolase